MSLLQDLRNAREILSFGREVVELLLDLGRLLKGQKEEQAEAILAERNRETIAGRKRLEASRLAGPRR